MTDDRNMTTHTYHEEVADEIYANLTGYYRGFRLTLFF
ncbi:hypothetical protein [Methanolobus sp.]